MEESVLTMIKAKSVRLSAQTLKGEMFYVPFSFGIFKRGFQSKAAAATLVCVCVCVCVCACVRARACVYTHVFGQRGISYIWTENHDLSTKAAQTARIVNYFQFMVLSKSDED